MANRLEELTGSQRKATEELRRLTSQLRQTGNRPSPAIRDAREELMAGLVQTARLVPTGGIQDDGPARESANRLSTTTSALKELSRGVAANTSALKQSSTATGQLAASLIGSLASELPTGGVSSLLKSGLGLAPIGSAIVGLFRKRDREDVPALDLYSPPAPRRLEAANPNTTRQPLPESVQGDRGNVRAIGPNPSTNVVVNVSAMDSRSFMDRSGEIASAVREAMLHMHPINDVVSEL